MTEIEELRETIRKQRAEIDLMRKAAEKRNRELDALHYVWCNGGCESGVHRYGEHPPLTKELVEEAIRNTNRLVTWLGSHSFKLANAALVHDGDSVRLQYGKWWNEWVEKANALQKELDIAKARIAELEAR